MEYLFAHPEAKPASSRPLDETTTVPQLLTTQWGQRTPYRDQCPTVDGIHCVTGCVATAMAQVMNYWKFPTILPNLPAYSTSTLTLPVPALPDAMAGWDQMLDTYKEGYYNEQQGAAVAQLMRYCGQGCKMDYRIASSGALTWNQLTAFKLFGYNENATCVQRQDYTDDEWHTMIQEDLRAGYPVIYEGSTSTESHNFVIDGFDGSKYHVNWGWDGMYDGYFELDAMNGGGYRPSQEQMMLHNVHPQAEVVKSDFVVDGIYYNHIAPGQAEVTYRDESYNSYSGDVVIPDTVSLFGTTYAITAIGENAFKGCTGLTSVTIPNTVTRIGNGAFGGATALTSVTIPNTVTRIGNGAFMRSGLQSIVIPDGVTIMEASAFRQCVRLTNVTLSNSLTEISDAIFNGCSQLTGIVLPSTIKSIGSSTFAGSGLTNISIPDGATIINESAFKDCAALESIDIPATIVTIGDEAFENCKSLKGVELGGALSSIGRSAFKDCTGMTTVDINDVGKWCKISFYDEYSNPLSCAHHLLIDGVETVDIVIPDSVTHISAFAFCNATALSSVTFPAGLTSVGRAAFKGCSKLKRMYISDIEAWLQLDYEDYYANPIALGCSVYYNGQLMSSDLVIPNTVRRIGRNAFVDCPWLKSISIPASVVEIGEDAFTSCFNLTALYIQDLEAWCGIRFRNISSNPLYHNILWTSRIVHVFVQGEDITYSPLELPASITAIGDYAFVGSRFSSIAFQEGLETIGTSAFYDSRSIKELVFPASLTTLGKESFAYCSSLTSVAFPDVMCSIEDKAFYYSGLTTVKLPDGLTTLGSSVFSYCWLLTDADLGKNLQKIPDGTFYGCRSLAHVTIPETVTEIGNNAFSDCAITAIPLTNSIHTIGDGAFKGCKMITQALIGDQVTSIGSNSFNGCSGLDSVVIGNGLGIIKEFSFYNCTELKHVTIGCHVDTIVFGTFLGCPGITDFTCRAKEPPLVMTNSSYDCFNDDIFNKATLYVPKNAVKAYKKANQWRRFKTIVGISMSGITGDVNDDGVVNIADVNVIINAILMADGQTDLDVNGDGDVNITDINTIIGIILND